MSWPAKDDVKTEYAKLNDTTLDPKIDRALTWAINRIKSRLAARYDVSGWDESTPPRLYDLALQFTYARFAFLVHTGSALKASDEAAKLELESAEKQLEALALGDEFLVDDEGVLIAQRGSSTGYIYQRTDGPIFTPDAPETWTVTLPVEGSEMV
jgi:hypothetical protein